MSYYFSVDGGGSKLNVMMFDEKMNLLGRGLSGGVYLTQTSMEDCQANVSDSLDQLFANGIPERIETVYLRLKMKSRLSCAAAHGKHTLLCSKAIGNR